LKIRSGRRPPIKPACALPPSIRVIATVDAGHDRLGPHVVRSRPVSLPHVDHEIERVVTDVDSHDLTLLDCEDRGLHRSALAPRGREAAEVLRVLPVEAEGDEPATV